MNVMNYKLTPEQYAALHAAQEAGVRFDSYLLAPGQRIWSGDFSKQVKNKYNYTAGTIEVKIAAHVDDVAANLQAQADYNKQCFNAQMREDIAKAVEKYGSDAVIAQIKAQQYKGPAE
jgi:hypothetical protein